MTADHVPTMPGVLPRSKPNSSITANMQRAEASRDIFAYIEAFCDQTMRHSAIGYLSPIEMEPKAA